MYSSNAVLTKLWEPAESYIDAMDDIVRDVLQNLVEHSQPPSHNTASHMPAARGLMIDAINEYCDTCKEVAMKNVRSLYAQHLIIRSKRGEFQVSATLACLTY